MHLDLVCGVPRFVLCSVEIGASRRRFESFLCLTSGSHKRLENILIFCFHLVPNTIRRWTRMSSSSSLFFFISCLRLSWLLFGLGRSHAIELYDRQFFLSPSPSKPLCAGLWRLWIWFVEENKKTEKKAEKNNVVVFAPHRSNRFAIAMCCCCGFCVRR